MQENIIGYLLGALDDDEMAQFEAALESDEELQQQVQDVVRGLQILGDNTFHDHSDGEPPQGLAEATMQRVARLSEVRHRELQQADSWSLLDMVVAASVLFLGSMLLTPAIQGSRIHARIAGCQDNLRQIGQALIAFSWSDYRQAFPEIPNDRRTGIAGIYAPTLLHAGHITEDRLFYCPEQPRHDLPDTGFHIPRLQEIAVADGPELDWMQSHSGGTYCYALGYFLHGKLQPVRNENRKNYPICADQPDIHAPGHRRTSTHRNVLFEYGGVRTFAHTLDRWNGDHLFRDALGNVQAGANKNDVVLGAGATRPWPLTGQATFKLAY